MNSNPHKARMSRNVTRRTGNIDKLESVLWSGIEKAKTLLSTTDDSTALRAIHALATIGGCYLKAVEVGELEARLQELERQLPTSNVVN